jgi:hypothetical protein
MRLCQAKGLHDVIASSEMTGEESSAWPGDYQQLPDDYCLKDSEGNPMILGRMRTTFFPIEGGDDALYVAIHEHPEGLDRYLFYAREHIRDNNPELAKALALNFRPDLGEKLTVNFVVRALPSTIPVFNPTLHA